ncbi:3-deoxy-manno-octulosonate cytidylyltransferase [Flavobacteriaceae bacterium F08102]|nr:3-deoxy-manno-octulosonate cytidylyltransferase [Flavobacteriaceae bacterium F08102]
MRILGIIPSRYGSTRLEGKPLLNLKGKTMIQRVYEQAEKALSNVLVATDDERIERTVKGFNGNVIMTSPQHTTGTNRCLEAYELYTKNQSEPIDVIINIQGDEPLLDPAQIALLADCFTDKSVTMATLAMPVDPTDEIHNGGVFVVLDNHKRALYFSRSVIPFIRDVAPEHWTKHHTFYKHVGMYGFRPSALKAFANLAPTSLEKAESLEQNRWLENGNSIQVALTNHPTIAIDTAEDLAKVRALLGE